MSKLKRECIYCQKEFFVYESSLIRSNSSGRFCSRSCYYNYLKTLTGNNNKKYKRIKKQCANCNKIIYVIPSRVKVYKNHFCCYDCKCEYHHNYIGGNKNCNWIGGHKNYRGDFETIKKKYFSGTNHCFVCNTTENIHIHHIIPYKLTKDNSLDNLMPLCWKHHRMVDYRTFKFYKDYNIYENYDSFKNEILGIILKLK